jgi:hypothetical protein
MRNFKMEYRRKLLEAYANSAPPNLKGSGSYPDPSTMSDTEVNAHYEWMLRSGDGVISGKDPKAH